MLFAIQEGFRALRRSWGLVLLVFAVNLGLAALLAAPLAGVLERDLKNTEAAANMMYGFDLAWWSRWSESQPGWTAGFEPSIFGVGFAFKNVDLLLKGQLPLGLFAASRGEAGVPAGPDAVILGLGALYLLIQTFLTGGLLGVFRSEQGSWTVRGVLHGSGFYFGRLVRVALIALLADWLVFRLNAPFARWVDRQALDAVSETTAMAFTLSRHALLLLALLFVNMFSLYAKVIVVAEERSSAVLAFLSSLSFCLGNFFKAAGHYLSLALIALVLLAAWSAVDFEPSGYKTQLVTLGLAQALVLGRIGLRLTLLAGQMALYRRACASR